jgi:hypothetical protein
MLTTVGFEVSYAPLAVFVSAISQPLNEAMNSESSSKYGAETVNRMQAGKAPRRFNADKVGVESMELSHEPVPAREGGRNVVPRWPQDHAAIDPFHRPRY